MDFKILRTKRLIDLNAFTKIVDLFQSTFKILDPDRGDRRVEYKTIHTVEEWEQGRPDKIAQKYYDNPNYVDGLLKYNELSNPFALEAGMLLYIPTKETLEASYRVLNFKENPIQDKLTRFTDKDKKSVVDSSRKDFNTSKKRNVPPNVQINGQTGITRDKKKNKLILGGNNKR